MLHNLTIASSNKIQEQRSPQEGEAAAEALHGDGVPGGRCCKGRLPAKAQLGAQGGQVVASGWPAPTPAAASRRGTPR